MSERPTGVDTASVVPVCPGCQSVDIDDFFETKGVPVDVGSLCLSEDLARSAPTGDITLAYCRACGLVSNRTFDSSRIAFQPGYEAGLEHSPLVKSSIDRMVERLTRKLALCGTRILEIGCGSGYVLRRLCEGGISGVGIDPTAPEERQEQVGSGNVRFIREFYSDRYQDLPFDLLFCQSVLEDIPDLSRFLSTIRPAVSRHGAKVYFEVFNAGRALEHDETFSIHYEQCNYFSIASLVKLFQHFEFHVLDAGIVPGNEQYLFIDAECRNGVSSSHARDRLPEAGQPLPEALLRFSTQHSAKVERWRNRLAELRAAGRRAVVWGSGGKGVSFLNAIGGESGIRYVVDINPKRQGHFIPRSAQQVVAPAFLAELCPDVVVVTNAAYEREIRERLAGLQLQPEILLV